MFFFCSKRVKRLYCAGTTISTALDQRHPEREPDFVWRGIDAERAAMGTRDFGGCAMRPLSQLIGSASANFASTFRSG
jgi:hypothetical protein